MKDYSHLRKELDTAIETETLAAARKAVSGADVEQELARIELLQKLRNGLPTSRYAEIYLAAVIAGTCLLLASLAWTIRWPPAKIHLQIKTDAVSFRLDAGVDWFGTWAIDNRLFQLQEFTRIELPPEFGPTTLSQGRARVNIEGGRIEVRRLHLEKGAKVQISAEPAGGPIDMETLLAGFRGSVDVRGQPQISAGAKPGSELPLPAKSFEIPGTVRFEDDGRQGVPARLRASAADRLVLNELHVKGLSFFKETARPNQEPIFVSAIAGGLLSLPDTAETSQLRAGEILSLENVEGTISELLIGRADLQLVFDGHVERVSIGKKGYQQQLTPSFLEYIYHQKRLGFFWGATVFVWGILWGGRRLLS
jgi:hypothetical protein